MKKSAYELLKEIKGQTHILRHSAKGIRSRPDYDKPSIRALLESNILCVAEFLQEIEAYLLDHTPKSKLIVFPSRLAAEPKTIAKKRKPPKKNCDLLGVDIPSRGNGHE